jgi:hypothetical protein
MTHGWAPSLREQRARFRACRDIGERLVSLGEILDWTWSTSLLRKSTDDGDRMEVKRARTARGMRLLVHLHDRKQAMR